MNKLELISTLKERANLTKSEASEVIKIFFDSLSDSFVNGDRVEIRGFCSFHIKGTKATQAETQKPAKKSPFLRNGSHSLNAGKN